MERLVCYFRCGLAEKSAETIGMEIETSFLDGSQPASLEQSQGIFRQLIKKGWNMKENEGQFITLVCDNVGNKILYELGRQNIEVATIPTTANKIITTACDVLDQVYEAARINRLTPYFSPILETNEDLLVIPDERDAAWVELDGREALRPLAKISAVQFTVEVTRWQAINCLNQLGKAITVFLSDYPQEEVWKEYIRKSRAGYLTSRYGGPLQFLDLEDYCFQLSKHNVVQIGKLIPFSGVSKTMDIPLFLRSIWWYFRLKRYGSRLCIEIRPLSRKEDSKFDHQLSQVLDIMNHQ